MKRFTTVNSSDVIDLLRSGAVGILRTDTLYGIVCRADNQAAVERIYRLKDRSEHKSPIVLVASVDQLFDVPSEKAAELLKSVWPGPVSVILPSNAAPKWLRRENDSIAYRLPAVEPLLNLILQTGPLIAPSANPEGQVPAMTVDEAYDYFGESVDFYVDGGFVEDNTPSKLIRVNENGDTERIR
ncbi:MAG TPA: L-threonylcarbamoyladenylate synthase [Candidatus Saccharibacteria bacterium]|nr:L-threonylcarbamoyladenylate synthase [Candidatus Saccharibacteria bacterium]HRK93817.1 L-threonylcarbamoyladenylate synthase [Candidatus Saccharibacteria bacterium]